MDTDLSPLYHLRLNLAARDRELLKNWDRTIYAGARCWVGGGKIVSQACEIVLAELVQNMIRYADWNHSVLPTLEIQSKGRGHAEIVTTNMADVDSEAHQRFQEILGDLKDRTIAKAAYKARAEARMFSEPKDGRSFGAGLLRIVVGACSKLTGCTNGEGLVTVKAEISKDIIVEALAEEGGPTPESPFYMLWTHRGV